MFRTMFTFEMPRIVLIRKPELAILYRLIQFIILTYFVIYVMWLKKGYQSFDRPISGVAVKVSGIAWKQIFKYQNRDTNGIIVVDSGDYLLQPTQNSGFYLVTTIKHFVIQRMTTCSEGDRLPDAQCQKDEDCPIGYQAGFQPYGPDGIVPDENNIAIDESGHGIFTGKCLHDYKKCQIFGWCPTGDDYEYELRKQRNSKLQLFQPPNILEGFYNYFTDLEFLDSKRQINERTVHLVDPLFEVVNFTLLIKNSIEFPGFKVKRSNILSWMTESYIQDCLYNAEHHIDKYCPRFRLNDIFKSAGINANRLLKYGGVVAITINWQCDLDWDIEYCVPSYEFLELESVHKVRRMKSRNTTTYIENTDYFNGSTTLSPESSTLDYTYAAYKPYDEDDIIEDDEEVITVHEGSNIRVTHYYGYDTEFLKQRRRILIHVNGIQFIIRVNGLAGKFNLLLFTMRFGSGLALLSIATILTDLILFYFTHDRKYYRQIVCDDKTLNILSKISVKTNISKSHCVQLTNYIKEFKQSILDDNNESYKKPNFNFTQNEKLVERKNNLLLSTSLKPTLKLVQTPIIRLSTISKYTVTSTISTNTNTTTTTTTTISTNHLTPNLTYITLSIDSDTENETTPYSTKHELLITPPNLYSALMNNISNEKLSLSSNSSLST
ncbi:P2X purinoceptor 4 [Schistosoma japonicum]|uniref:P2X purinoceptor 4 n=1 Tax=Schistosoma japonicum TaxID=6182 RepID=A0A4Z2CRR4_SCHJA|nr:P2X purinoceptor 4 [Schistosoma japonicum]